MTSFYQRSCIFQNILEPFECWIHPSQHNRGQGSVICSRQKSKKINSPSLGPYKPSPISLLLETELPLYLLGSVYNRGLMHRSLQSFRNQRKTCQFREEALSLSSQTQTGVGKKGDDTQKRSIASGQRTAKYCSSDSGRARGELTSGPRLHSGTRFLPLWGPRERRACGWSDSDRFTRMEEMAGISYARQKQFSNTA